MQQLISSKKNCFYLHSPNMSRFCNTSALKRQIAIKDKVLLVLDFRTCLLLDSLLIANKENIFRCQLTIELRQQMQIP